MEETGATWEELMRRQDQEQTEQFQSDLKEASDYLRPILDNMVTDLREKQVEQQAQFEQMVDEKSSQLKEQIAQQAKEDLDNLESFINDADAAIDQFTSMTYEEMEAQMQPMVMKAVTFKKPVHILQEDDWSDDEPDMDDQIEDAMEEASRQIRDAFVSYGWDSAAVESWMEETGATWEELMRRQDKEQNEQFQSDLKEASDYLKPILDNMVADLREKQVEQQAQFEQMVDEKSSELKTQVAEQAKTDLDNLEAWINDTYDGVQEYSNMSYDDIEAQWNEAVYLATKTETVSDSSYSAYGYGALSLGIAAAAIYMFNKKKEAKANSDAKQSLLVDEEFVLV